MVLPVLLLFLLGVIDVGRFMWTMNRAEKAAQMGVRFAIVTDSIPSGLNGYNFTGTSSLQPGDTVPTSAYSKMTCSKPGSGTESCACASGGSCPWGTSVTSGAFGRLQSQMEKFLPELKASNIQVDYVPSGLGFAGDPSGPNIYPIVTVRLTGLTFTPLLAQFFGASFTIPDVQTSLTMEDGTGQFAN